MVMSSKIASGETLMRQASGVWRRLLTGIVPAICLIAGLFAPAMADDFRIENYKRAIEALVEGWATDEIEYGAQLTPIREELATLEQTQSPSDAEKAQITELRRQRDGIEAEMKTRSDDLERDLTLVEVDKEAPKSEIASLPDWAKDIKDMIKAKGLPIGRGIVIVPNVDFDPNKGKLKEVSVAIRFNW
jgi:hypothetical protein